MGSSKLDVLEDTRKDLKKEAMTEKWWKIDSETYTKFCADSAQSEHVLLSSLNAMSYQENQRAMVVFEYIFGVIHFCSENSYPYEEAMLLLGIHQRIFTQFVVDNSGEQTHAISMFQSELKECRSFSVDMCRAAATFFSIAFVRNFDAYQYALSNLPVEKVQRKLLCVQTPHSLPSLSEAGSVSSSSTIA